MGEEWEMLVRVKLVAIKLMSSEDLMCSIVSI